MSTLDKSDKYALDEEQKFKAEARRNRLLGMWVAEKLGMTGDAATAYAKEVVASDFEEAGDGDVVAGRPHRQGHRNDRTAASRQEGRADGDGGDAGEGGDVKLGE